MSAGDAGADHGGVVYRLGEGGVRAVLRVMDWRLHVQGAHHVPAHGAAVVVCNHVSYVDPVTLLLGIRRRGRWPRFLAKRELFAHPVAGPLLRSMGHVCVDRTGDAATAYREALGVLGDGGMAALFPEATISTSFELRPLKTGAARMALAGGVPVVPAATWGGQRLLTKGRPAALLRRGVPLVVRFGPPLRPEEHPDAEALTATLTGRLHGLVREAVASYPDLPAAGDAWWLPASLRPGTDGGG